MTQFDTFVVFAEMRTGSNFLEANLNALDGVTCHGEAFNLNFISYPSRKRTFEMSLEDRDANPEGLLHRIAAADGMNGFRYFSDHDPRVFDAIVKNRHCAKIVLTRNPAESYVSYKIAKATKQWKLNDVKRRREDTIVFDPDQFEAHITRLQGFQVKLLNALQVTGQSAFYVDYEDLQNVDVMNGLAAYLGVPSRLKALDDTFKKQNPASLADKVENFEEMEAALARADRFNLTRTPNFEPRRGPSVPGYIAAPVSPLMYLPIRGGPIDAVSDWLAGLDDVDVDDLLRKFTQNSLKHWKADHPGHRTFTVVRHPVARAHAVFCDRILNSGEGGFTDIRAVLRQHFKLPIPARYPDAKYGTADHKTAFLAFLKFLKANLANQTAIRVDPHWATQAQTVEGFAEFASPDLILREDALEESLAIAAAQVGLTTMPQVADVTDTNAEMLDEIYDETVEATVADVYQRDYVTFGFGPYKG
ncbi:sulfotransferase family 2 domain-containing protein [Pseudooctadecabacter jejudonensis]|uniref:Sulfotransferase family protein n=1 Tax=Pseudooctadecabacter jejudonensis TaxID=1391910 RepID=A0A1Y5SC46_9RHOB|nr:sulfotransferase family 2 domain-containing protein [Pseudooctadecabacter jejudonensis]SLN34229.1 Sulfotransferase family protein [Pseudooctadecabacter jejudonensis]